MTSVVISKCRKCEFAHKARFTIPADYPGFYRDTVRKMQNGEMGEEAKAFFAEHPDGAINGETVFMQCEECNHIAMGPMLSMYTQKEDAEIINPDRDYVVLWAERYNYDKHSDYPHKCPKCNGKMKLYTEQKFYKSMLTESIRCPLCDSRLMLVQQMVWD